MLTLVRRLIAVRRELDPGLELLDSAPGVLAFARGDHRVMLNTSAESSPAPAGGEVVVETHAGALRDGTLAPHAGVLVR